MASILLVAVGQGFGWFAELRNQTGRAERGVMSVCPEPVGWVGCGGGRGWGEEWAAWEGQFRTRFGPKLAG